MSSGTSYLHIMKKAVEKAAFGIVRDFGEVERLQSSSSSLERFVESAYKRSEEQLKYVLAKSYPDFSFSDQGRSQIPDKICWVINPISGYQNFERSIPYFSVTVSLFENRNPIATLVLDPIRGEYFKAENGAGAFVNNRHRLRVSLCREIEGSVIAVHIPYYLESIFFENKVVLKRMGDPSLDLAYFAAGKLDACVIKNKMFHEICSGILLARESGGFLEIQENQDKTFDIVAASSLEIMKKLLSFYNTI